MTALDTRVNPAVPTTFGIGELSARTGVSARSLRYYEEQGLLAPDRTAAGHRRFDAEAVDRVLLVQRLFAAGLSSTEIAPLLIVIQLEEFNYDGAAAIGIAMLLISFAMLLAINLIQIWSRRRIGHV